jgi:hypothetical protein
MGHGRRAYVLAFEQRGARRWRVVVADGLENVEAARLGQRPRNARKIALAQAMVSFCAGALCGFGHGGNVMSSSATSKCGGKGLEPDFADWPPAASSAAPTVASLRPRLTSTGITLVTSVVLPEPLQPARPMTRI